VVDRLPFDHHQVIGMVAPRACSRSRATRRSFRVCRT
jgi:hypothetical protein